MSALTLTAAQRSALRGLAHGLNATVHIGQQGVSASVIAEIDAALRAHGLIKVRVLEAERAEREEMLTEIANALFCAPVQHIGRMLVLWRPRPQDAVQLKVDAPSIKEAPAKDKDKSPERAPRAPRAAERSRDSAPSDRRREGDRSAPRKPGPKRESSAFGAARPRVQREATDRPKRTPYRDEQNFPEREREAPPRRPRGEGSLKDEWFKGAQRPSVTREEREERPASERPSRSASSERAPRSASSERPARSTTSARAARPPRSTETRTRTEERAPRRSAATSDRGRRPKR